MNESLEPASPAQAPALRVVRGTPTEAELAALVAVLAARGSASDDGADSASGNRAAGWRSRADGLRRPLLTGPAAWRAAPWLR